MNKSSFQFWILFLIFGHCHVAEQIAVQNHWDWSSRVRTNNIFEKPVIKSFIIRSQIEHRYAITTVQSLIFNPANTIDQVFNFKFVLPKTAFISKISLNRTNHIRHQNDFLTSKLNQSDWLLQQLQPDDDENEEEIKTAPITTPSNAEDVTRTNSNRTPPSFHIEDLDDDVLQNQFKSKPDSKKVNVKQISLPIHMKPMDEVTLTLIYEYSLERSNNKFTHMINVCPGELIQDFQIYLTVTENSPIVGMKAKLPIIGPIPGIRLNNKAAQVHLNLSLVEQFDYFGNQGFSGDVRLEYDVELDGESEIIYKNGFFAHFYNGPPTLSDMHVIPMHVIIAIDIGRSMGGPKIMRAKELVQILISLLDENFLLNLIIFNERVTQWRPDEAEEDDLAFPFTGNILDSAISFVDGLEAHSTNVSDLTGAVLRGIELDRKVRLSGTMPNNSLTTMILLTDGRSGRCNAHIQKKIVQTIHKANRVQQIPIFTLGVGFDTNMDLLEEISHRTPGGVAENSKEDLEAGPQLTALRLQLKDVILKHLNFNYAGKEFNKNTLTKSRFKYFHLGSSVLVTGKYDQAFPPRVTIHGESVKGHYEEILDERKFGAKKICQGSVTLCSEARFRGECVILTDSRPSLKDKGFSNRAASIKIIGECAWIVCELKNYRGFNLTLLPGSYEMLPDMHRRISSLKKVSLNRAIVADYVISPENENEFTKNTVARLWAFHTVQNILENEEDKAWGHDHSERRASLLHGFQIASDFEFLTPLTDLYLRKETSEEEYVEQETTEDTTLENILLTYNDLDPILSHSDDPELKRQWAVQKVCTLPIQCQGNFLFEHYQEDESASYENDNLDLNYGKPNCTGSITVYSKPKLRGDSLKVDESLCQLYHVDFSQRIVSIRSEGNCCWVLFQHSYFVGESERVCGKYSREVRLKNIRSIMKIGSG